MRLILVTSVFNILRAISCQFYVVTLRQNGKLQLMKERSIATGNEIQNKPNAQFCA